jgi:hypothetical protein
MRGEADAEAEVEVEANGNMHHAYYVGGSNLIRSFILVELLSYSRYSILSSSAWRCRCVSVPRASKSDTTPHATRHKQANVNVNVHVSLV